MRRLYLLVAAGVALSAAAVVVARRPRENVQTIDHGRLLGRDTSRLPTLSDGILGTSAVPLLSGGGDLSATPGMCSDIPVGGWTPARPGCHETIVSLGPLVGDPWARCWAAAHDAIAPAVMYRWRSKGGR